MSDEEIHRLTKYFSIPSKLEVAQTSEQIDRQSRAIKYKELIDGGYFKNQADLARHIGVSRAWITKVMNELKR